jgi:hypothetical protein
MAEQTTNYKLIKPMLADEPDITAINPNWDTIDSELKGLHANATISSAGLMSAADKTKLEGIATGATANTGTITGVTGGNGLTGSGTSGSVTLNVGAGTGISVAADSVSAKLRSTTALTRDSAAATETANRVYPVAVDKSGYLAVNVPWTDTDTTYTLSSFGITATAAELNKLDGVTATTTELNYVDGVTSNIQTQLNNKPDTNTTYSISKTGSTITLTGSDGSTSSVTDADTNTTQFTITADASDDDVVVLSGTNGTNKVTYSASHAKKGPSTTASTTKGATANATISGSGATGSIKVPKVTVD